MAKVREKKSPVQIDTPHRTEAHKGVLSLATEAFKYLALANGGAAVALLSSGGADKTVPNFISGALEGFAFGLMACGGSVLAMLVAELVSFYQPETPTAWPNSPAVLQGLACVFIALSTAFFAYGCGVAVGAIEARGR